MKVVFHYSSGKGLSTDLEKLSQQGLTVQQIPVEDQVGFASAMKDCEVLWHVLELLNDLRKYFCAQLQRRT